MSIVRSGRITIIPLLLLGLGLCVPVSAQEGSGPTASDSMKRAGTDTENAVKNAWQGTKTAVSDTKITAKVKTALHDDKLTKDSDIDVHTSAGTVTLTGKVKSIEVGTKAAELTRDIEGVRSVDNRLEVLASTE